MYDYSGLHSTPPDSFCNSLLPRMERPPSRPKGRSTAANPINRFETLEVVSDEAPPDRVPTLYLRDDSRTVLARNESPDVPFDASINPYRGCEHGCIYCFARPFHEYLGFSAGLDFETRILVKENAPELLASELRARSWQPQLLGMSGATDPYQPIDRKLQLTRGCLEVLAAFRNPVGVITKNELVTRDIDHLTELARFEAVSVVLSITTLDADLARVMEPRTSHPRNRLGALEKLAAAGIPCGVSIAPVIPGLNEHEIPSILERAAEAGANFANWLLLRLPGAVEGLFSEWLEQTYPDRAAKVLNRLREIRGGRLHDSRFGKRMRGEGVFAEQIRSLFAASCKRLGLATQGPTLSVAAFRRPNRDQMDLF